MIKAKNLNHASIELSRAILSDGIPRETRGFKCWEFEDPIMVCIENPLDRYVNIPDRKSSKTLPFAESLALLSGMNWMDLYSGYVPEMIQYSDNGVHQRAGYGPRIRHFIGLSGDYASTEPFFAWKSNNRLKYADQLKYIVESLKKDPNTRQAVISITDPAVDQLDDDGKLIETKDIPCCRLLQFMIVNGKLNCTAYFRSNDLLYGFQQVNVFNGTFIQEVVAMIIGVPVGKYYHFANNLHFYEDKISLVENNAKQDKSHFQPFEGWDGYGEQMSLNQFDGCIAELEKYRKAVKKNTQYKPPFESSFFQDWAKVFYRFHTKDHSVNFKNPYINRLFNRPTFKVGAEYVKVLQDGKWVFYEVFKPKAYLAECARDGKVAEYVGRADRYGYLNN